MVRMSESEQNELWDRWEAGESQRSIARALGRPPETIRGRLLASGWSLAPGLAAHIARGLKGRAFRSFAIWVRFGAFSAHR
jgi:helix-turn-helix protein